jgi:hypothetical protein
MDKIGYFNNALEFVNVLEGYKTFFKNAHWSAGSIPLHEKIDSFLDELTEFQDTIAETSQGYCDLQFGIGEIQGTPVKCLGVKDGIRTLNDKITEFLNKIVTDGSLAGVVNAVNDFQQTVLKYKYLFNLATETGIVHIPAKEHDIIGGSDRHDSPLLTGIEAFIGA